MLRICHKFATVAKDTSISDVVIREDRAELQLRGLGQPFIGPALLVRLRVGCTPEFRTRFEAGDKQIFIMLQDLPTSEYRTPSSLEPPLPESMP